ncbi:MAG: ribosome-associated translation inhibitor RaiA [Minisyncoccia bacterium]
MNIIIKKNIDLTPALEDYLRKKFATLEKFVVALAGNNPAELTIEIERTTKHHRKGDVFRASAKLHFSGIVLRAEKDAEDIRVALDAAKDTLREEIERYKDKNLR